MPRLTPAILDGIREAALQQMQARRISLAEAQRLAIEALLEAEERRRGERKREAAFWNYLELQENRK